MKRISALLLVLSLMLLCWGCHNETVNNPESPQIRYENGAAFYTQTGGDYTMELRFKEPVDVGSEIKILLEDREVLGFTTGAAVSRLEISSPELALNLPYTIMVNGKLQCHGTGTEEQEFPQPGDIPEPSQPTIPVEPMGEAVTIPTQSTEGEEPLSFGNISSSDLKVEVGSGGIPSLTPTEQGGAEDSVETGGILPVTPFTPHGQEDSGLQTGVPQIPSLRKSQVFALTEKTTIFVSVGDAA